MEYIEREALRKAVRSKATTKYDWSEEIDFEDFEKVLDAIPAADVAPVVHGMWVPVPNTGVGATGRCTVCNKAIYGFTAYNYCPNCGADMRGE